MQIARRPLASGDTDYELLWLAVSVGGVGLAAVWFKLHLPWPICVFHNWTGHPCATCGATRAAIALLQGHFLAALAWNPLAFLHTAQLVCSTCTPLPFCSPEQNGCGSLA